MKLALIRLFLAVTAFVCIGCAPTRHIENTLSHCSPEQFKQDFDNHRYHLKLKTTDEKSHQLIVVTRWLNQELTAVGLSPLGAKMFDGKWEADSFIVKPERLAPKIHYNTLLASLYLVELKISNGLPECIEPSQSKKQAIASNAIKNLVTNINTTSQTVSYSIPELGYNISYSKK